MLEISVIVFDWICTKLGKSKYFFFYSQFIVMGLGIIRFCNFFLGGGGCCCKWLIWEGVTSLLKVLYFKIILKLYFLISWSQWHVIMFYTTPCTWHHDDVDYGEKGVGVAEYIEIYNGKDSITEGHFDLS